MSESSWHHLLASLLLLLSLLLTSTANAAAISYSIPPSPPPTSVPIDPSLLSVSIEFFAFPAYTSLSTTHKCLANLEDVRGAPPAVRIGGTTQDRATYDPTLPTTSAVQYTLPNGDPGAAPDALTYGPQFFVLAASNAMRGEFVIGFNRQLNDLENTRMAAEQAQRTMGSKLVGVELGNEPEFYNSSSKIIPSGQRWSPTLDGASQKQWFTTLASSVGNIFQAGVYLQIPTWSNAGLIPRLGDAISRVRSFSGHSYPQSACGGASTDLERLMSHSGIVSYTKQYAAEASAVHAQGKRYFLGETNSATCGGGGISPTFGAALWVMDYALQAALNNVERLYFHQGTIGNCAYCFWGSNTVNAPYYGAYFVSLFLGSEPNTRLSMLDPGNTSLGAYVVYNSAGTPLRISLYNSDFFTSGTRPASTVTLNLPSTVPSSVTSVRVKRLTAPNANSVGSDAGLSIGGGLRFDSSCARTGNDGFETLGLSGRSVTVTIKASEAAIVFLQ